MQKLSVVSVLIWLMCITTVNAQSNQKVKTINGIKCSLHKVIPKETWSSVSRKYSLSIDEIKSVNPGINDLKIGQIINIPEGKATENINPATKPAETNTINAKPQVFTHAVSAGETLYGISKQYMVTVDDLKKWNNLKSNNAKVGQIIFVSNPDNANEYATLKKKAEPVAEVKKESPIAENKTEDKKPQAINEPVKNIEVKNTSAEIAANNKTKPAEPAKNSSIVVSKKEDANNPLLADAGNKIIAVSDTREKITEPEIKPVSRPEKKSKAKTGNSVVEITENGMAAWLKDGGVNQNKFYGLHRTAPLGTIIKVTNRMNDEYVFVKIVGQLPDTGDNDKQIIKVSEAAAKRIGAVDEKFQVELSYGMLQ